MRFLYAPVCAMNWMSARLTGGGTVAKLSSETVG
jgi:hypothetical protein